MSASENIDETMISSKISERIGQLENELRELRSQQTSQLVCPPRTDAAYASRSLSQTGIMIDKATMTVPLLWKDIDDMRQAARHFPWFPKLPAELRQLIWKFALPSSKFITIHTSTVLDENGQRKRDVETWHTLPHKTPAIFDACKEGRHVYKLTHTFTRSWKVLMERGEVG
ncbi:hypothetical protein GLAREA_02525 [Glarea lozoyensis ATCC 20868]|uniref:2EXR domain-containing protein n=1 Tax=Glarea lozoyensis (strain ATCC 20868 / MF5171) TaxID=1116229 RepID=S3CJB2_GLAL2|nr:uncharacterized protein GLAREA_02525 [Glarea lozoyensis ATCC 20868]EPE26612.1 hypothetical protein GLAREA_02525 [Glarea lozoyensis ATCC 20868]